MIPRLSYWFLPVLSGAVWLGMLLGMLIGWAVDTHREHYPSMDDDQTVAYISDIGASHRFKPVFIALCAVTTATLDLSFLADRWLRHRGRLTPNGSAAQKTLGVLAILFALAGTAGLVLLSVFDVAHHKSLHDGFLLLFLGGYVLSAICICWEYQRLGWHNRHIRILRASFWIKLAFVLVELVLAIVFVGLTFTHHSTGGAVVEWIIAFIFAFYIFSFCIDLYPAVRTRSAHAHRRAFFGLRRRRRRQQQSGSSSGPDKYASTASDTATDPAAAAENGMVSMGPVGVPATQHGASDGAYGESAARATRAPRTAVQPPAAAPAVAPAAAPAELPATYQPGRTYNY